MFSEEQKIIDLIKEFEKKLPRFLDGRINYSNSDIAPVITIFIRFNGKILILKRSNKVSTYRGKWNTVAGYLDEPVPIIKKILEEISEEIGVSEKIVKSHSLGKTYKFTDLEINKTWIVQPALVELNEKPEIKLDWEHIDYKWIKPDEIKEFDIVPNIDKSLRMIM
jgi:isopentenyldiphosphate isomerase